ncbi:MAG: SusC/RagA family TonB-linked outer membrane protein, partial [Bacteroidota bacterium]
MKKLLLMVLMSLALTPLLLAQSTVTGKITSSDDGSPIPGANVLEKGTSNGAITDIDGNYRISVGDGATLVFSFIGFQTQEMVVGTQSSINVTLDVDVQALDEVVVTAFGIEREKKALGYSVTQVDGKKFTESRAVNLGTALTGKIAGVNVNVPATGAAGQSRVVIRGGSSLSGDDQPLYVINGVPMDNTNQGAAGLWGGQDSGNGLSSLNPDDIESISVLKGMTAAALYGSRANTGVILITTKSGRAQDGITVDFNSNFTFDVPFDLSEWQNQYGHGTNGEKPLTQEGALSGGGFAWGDRLDGSNVVQFDGIERPYSDVGEDIRDFYDIGRTFTNTLGLSGGGENYNFRFSASLLDNEDIMPNAGFERQTYATNVTGKLGKFTATVSGQYSEEDTKNRPRVSDTPGNGNFTALMRPATISYDVLRGPTDKFGANEDGFERRSQGNTFSQNPYWAAYQFARNDQRNRLLGNMSLRWDPLDWVYVQGRIGTDYQNRESEETEPYGTAYKPLGSFNTRNRTVQETNIDLLIGANQTFGDFGVEVLLGGNRMRRSNKTIRIGGNELSVPFFGSVNNVAQQTYSFGFQEFGINSIFGQGTVSWRNSIFLNGTVRRDQFSQLNPDDNAVWYPSVGLSMVLTEVFELPSI